MNEFKKVLLNNWNDVSNESINTLLNDYKIYHGIIFILFLLLVVGSFFVGLMLFKKYRYAEGKKFESRSLLVVFIGTVILFSLSLLLAFANASNTFTHPESGFQAVTEEIENSPDNYNFQKERHAFASWIDTRESNLSYEVQKEVNNWRNFHVKKAILSLLFFIAIISVMYCVWRYLLEKEKEMGKLSLSNYAGFFSLLIPSSTLLLMVIANVQGAFAPLFSYLEKLI